MPISTIRSAESFAAERLRIRECRADLTKFLDGYGFHLFITLVTNRTGDAAFARDKFKGFMARFDRHNGGRNWHKNSSIRSLAIASPEHMDTNLHLHILLQIPAKVLERNPLRNGRNHKKWKALAAHWRPIIESLWSEICPQGNADVLPFWQGATSYTMKGAGNRVSYSNFMLSTEFHTALDNFVKCPQRDANSRKQRNDELRLQLLRRERFREEDR